jgi:hypothetical protein
MENDAIRGCHDFFVAQVGASAALTGLIFVAVSINLEKILKFAHLPTRALEALATLVCVLLVCTCALVPQPYRVLGVEVAVIGLLLWVVQTRALASTRRSGYESPVRILFNQLPQVPFVVAGVLMTLGLPSGVYWILPGTLLAVISGTYSAWVLLVEIQR